MSKLLVLVTVSVLLRILAGETAGCPAEAKLAMLQVYQNREDADISGGWFGDADPTPLDWAVYTIWSKYDLPSVVGNDALYFIGPGDAAKMPWLKRMIAEWQCNGTHVSAWE